MQQVLEKVVEFIGVWLQALVSGARYMIVELGWWNAIPLTIVGVLLVLKLTPLGWVTDRVLGFVLGNAWFYFKRLIANSFAVWVFIGSMAFEPLRRFARWQDTISYDYQQAFFLLALLVAQGAICFWAARRQWRLVTDMNTTVDTLKFESRTTGLIAVVLTYISGWLIARHYMPWGLYVPWLFTVYSAWEIWDRTVNTAALKPQQQMQVVQP